MSRKIAFLNDPLNPERLNQSMQIAEKLRPMFDRGGSSNIRPQSTLKLEWLRPSKQPLRGDLHPEALESLKASVQEHGIVEPLVVRLQQDHYEVICGHRRLQAAQELGLGEVPVVVRELDDSQAFVLSLHENIHRDDLTPLEEAKAYKKILDAEIVTSRRQLAKILGVSHTRVNQKLGLLEAPEEIQEMMEAGTPALNPDPEPTTQGGNRVSSPSGEGGGNPVSTRQKADPERKSVLESSKLTERHVRALRRLKDGKGQVELAQEIVARKLNVAQTEERVGRELEKRGPRKEKIRKAGRRSEWVQLGSARYKETEDCLIIEVRCKDPEEQEKHLKEILVELRKIRKQGLTKAVLHSPASGRL